MPLPPPPPLPKTSPPPRAAGNFGTGGKREPEIITIPDKFYGVALKLKVDDTFAAPPPPPPPPTLPPVPSVILPPAPSHAVLWLVLGALGLTLLIGGGFVYFNRTTLFKPKVPPPVVIPVPLAATNLTATSTGVSATLSWTDNATNESGYRLERQDGNGTFLPLTNLPPNSTAFLDVSVQTGQSYTYRVIAMNASGEAAASNEAGVSVPLPPPPVAPPIVEEKPTLPPGGLDSDSDGLSDLEEPLYGTDPQHPDSDGDGFLDGNEAFHLYNPAAKAPVRLLDSGLVKVFSASAGWSMYIPASWAGVLDSPDGARATITTNRAENFKISLVDNNEQQTPLTWYLAQHPGVISSSLRPVRTKGGLDGLLSEDRLTAFFAWGNKIFVLQYDLNGESFINFRTTYEMMLNSLKLPGAPLITSSPTESLGPGALVGNVSSTSPLVSPLGSATSSMPAAAATSSLLLP